MKLTIHASSRCSKHEMPALASNTTHVTTAVITVLLTSMISFIPSFAKAQENPKNVSPVWPNETIELNHVLPILQSALSGEHGSLTAQQLVDSKRVDGKWGRGLRITVLSGQVIDVRYFLGGTPINDIRPNLEYEAKQNLRPQGFCYALVSPETVVQLTNGAGYGIKLNGSVYPYLKSRRELRVWDEVFTESVLGLFVDLKPEDRPNELTHYGSFSQMNHLECWQLRKVNQSEIPLEIKEIIGLVP